ncbi:pyruvate kinase PKM-like isoform X3 [Alosa pseudoharengus]|uniref:pyruvate kinase PKM-like isoform X3 n=1 Tax=Alosa pseudoharengus TaxID=34774 RepID=UPI003F8A1C89
MAQKMKDMGSAFIQQQQLHAAMADTYLEHMCLLDIDSEPNVFRTTGMVCTIGPASRCVKLVKGEMLKLTMDDQFKENCNEKNVWVDYKDMPKVVEVGKHVYLDNGSIRLMVKSVGNDFLECEIENGGTLGSKKGVNVRGASWNLPAVSEKDTKNLQFAVEHGVDMVFASFMRKAADVHAVRKAMGEKGKDIKVFSKIENHEGCRKFDEIMEASDGIMVARGNLGIEMPIEKVFLAQKMMIGRCNRMGKPVICGMQMLESMIKKPRPTRAESVDVANAVLDGADCLMLCGETAKGEYPVESVRMQHKICREAEAAMFHRQLFEELRRTSHLTRDPSECVAMGAVEASFKCCASAIIVLTKSGRSAHMLSRYRPRSLIMAVTRNEQTARQCHMYRGVKPVFYNKPAHDVWAEDVDQRVIFAMEMGKHRKYFKSGDVVIVVTGWRPGSGYTNTFRIVLVP